MMNLFRLSMRYLRIQKKRTIATVLGVIMSVALVTGTALLVTSYQDMAMKQEQLTSGTWHYKLTEKITPQQAEMLNSNYLIEKAGIGSYDRYLDMGTVNSGDSEDPQISTKMYLRELSPRILDEMPYQIMEGRMPQNRNEIALHASAKEMETAKHLKIGDTISKPIYVGEPERYTEGEIERPNDSEPVEGSRTFTVVGYYDSNVWFYEQECEALTVDPEGEHSYFAYANVKPVPDYMKSLKKALDDCGIPDEGIMANSYLEYLGQGDSFVVTALRSTLLILALIIMTVMVIVISNSFSMSVTEKISQIGTLRCIGATPAQIRSMTMYEALIIWLIALPVGLLAGTAAMMIVFRVISNLGSSMSFSMRIIPSAMPYVLPAILSFLAVMVSAYFPARKANRVSMVEAVRGNTDYQNASIKRTRKGRLWGKAFGFPGFLAAKNIRRNKRRFRITVLSVIVSVTMFVSVGGFAGSVQSAVEGTYVLFQKDFEFYYYEDMVANGEKTRASFLNLEKEISNINGVEWLQRCEETFLELQVPPERKNSDYEKASEQEGSLFMGYGVREDGKTCVFANVVPVSRENYGSLKISGSAPSYDDLISQKQVLLCQKTVAVTDGGRIMNADIADFRVGDKLNTQFYAEGPEDEDGSLTQIVTEKDFTVGGLIEEVPWYVAGEQPTGCYIVIPRELFDDLRVERGLICLNTYLAVKAQDGREEELSKTLSEISSQYPEIDFYNIYRSTQETRTTFMIMSIFIYGFMAVIILICCVSVFNTINTNLLLRRRETAMICAVGMDKGQLIRTLLIECALYGIIGTFWGTLCGLPLLFLLSLSFNVIIGTESLLAPMRYVLLALIGSVVISILAGIGPIRKMVKAPIVEQIRAQE